MSFFVNLGVGIVLFFLAEVVLVVWAIIFEIAHYIHKYLTSKYKINIPYINSQFFKELKDVAKIIIPAVITLSSTMIVISRRTIEYFLNKISCCNSSKQLFIIITFVIVILQFIYISSHIHKRNKK